MCPPTFETGDANSNAQPWSSGSSAVIDLTQEGTNKDTRSKNIKLPHRSNNAFFPIMR